ncbi:MAG: hypothetical protein P1P85_04635 [Patescibacteria group bacterium]|nr:hypothetical protein [Patescibacteria group bacterium]
MFKNYKIIKKLKELRRENENNKFLFSLREDLKKYISENPICEKDVTPEVRSSLKAIKKLTIFDLVNSVNNRLKFISNVKAVAFVSLAFVFLTAGVTMASQKSLPGEILYSVKLMSEDVQLSFSLSPESKAKLHTTFAAKRVTEIKLILKEKEVEPKGLEIALSRLQYNTNKAADNLEKKRKDGIDVSELAKEINNVFNAQKKEIKQAFKEKENNLKKEGHDIKEEIREAKKINNISNLGSLVEQLSEVNGKRKTLRVNEKEVIDIIKEEEKKVERKMDKNEKEIEDRKEAEEEIAEAEKEEGELISKAEENGLALTDVIFSDFEEFILKAKEYFESGDYEKADDYANYAKESLEGVEDKIEELSKEVREREDKEDDNRNGDNDEKKIDNEKESNNKENSNN